MKRRYAILLAACLLAATLNSTASMTDKAFAAEASEETETESTETESAETADEVLADGTYTAVFNTDSSMFHVNEANDDKGVLTVKDGQMTIHVSLVSKNILNLYCGTSEEARKDGAVLLQPTTDTVTYDDGDTEEVYGFDIPVPYLDDDFDLALIGEKGVWYDHKVSVTDVEPYEAEPVTAEDLGLADGTYTAAVTLEGGSGKASVDSPAEIRVEDGEITAVITWSSPYYDYMMIGDERYEPVNTEGNSVFEIPITGFDAPVAVSADTTAMSKPYLIDYTLTFDSATVAAK